MSFNVFRALVILAASDLGLSAQAGETSVSLCSGLFGYCTISLVEGKIGVDPRFEQSSIEDCVEPLSEALGIGWFILPYNL